MQRRAFFIAIVGISLALFSAQGFAGPQQPMGGPGMQGRRGRMGMMGPGNRTMGTITSIGSDQFEIKKSDGSTLTVVVSDGTRFGEGRGQQIQFNDLKPGDHVFVMGQAGDNNQLDARMVRRVTEQEMERFRSTGDRAFGRIVSIKKNKLKISNPRRGDQTVVVNDQTQFMKDGQAITLKDLKVGDHVFAMGKELNGKFVATRVTAGQPGGWGRRGGRGGMMGPPPSSPQQ